MQRKKLVDYAFRLARLTSRDVRFVIIDGSVAEGSDRRHSDYDIAVVRKGLSSPPGCVKSLFGVFEGRIVSGWLVDEESFKHRYLGDDDLEFLWRRRQLSKARLLFGDVQEFAQTREKALRRPWTKRRESAVIRESYMTMVEYMGKMLNKVDAGESLGPEFYQDGYIIAQNAALLVAGLNRVDLDSDRTMYRQIFASSTIAPPGFPQDFKMASGLSASRRKSAEVIESSKRLLRWARKEILHAGPHYEVEDSGFWQVVREVRF